MSGFPLPNSPIVLLDETLELRELNLSVAQELWEVARDKSLWKFSADVPGSLTEFEHYIRQAMLSRKLNTCVPFALWDVASNRYVGATRLANMDYQHRRAEIGWTWLALSAQRSFVNSTAKRMLLDYAFSTLECIRVELKCSNLNLASRAAIERLGATFEGTLRAHMQLPDGSRRDTCYYSILIEEWPALRAKLIARSRRAV